MVDIPSVQLFQNELIKAKTVWEARFRALEALVAEQSERIEALEARPKPGWPKGKPRKPVAIDAEGPVA